MLFGTYTVLYTWHWDLSTIFFFNCRWCNMHGYHSIWHGSWSLFLGEGGWHHCWNCTCWYDISWGWYFFEGMKALRRCPTTICAFSTWLNHCCIALKYQVEWSKNDGDFIHKGLQFGKVRGKTLFGKHNYKSQWNKVHY